MPQPFNHVVRGVNQAAANIKQQVINAPMSVPQAPQFQYPMQPQQQPVHYAQPQSMTHPAYATMPWAVPVNYPGAGMQVPSFLTVPEPIIPGQSLTRPFFSTMGRTLLKALGMSAANWFDHVPWTPWPQPHYSVPNPPGHPAS